MLGLNPNALKKLKQALTHHSPKQKSSRERNRMVSGPVPHITHEVQEDLKQGKNLKLPQVFNELITRKA